MLPKKAISGKGLPVRTINIVHFIEVHPVVVQTKLVERLSLQTLESSSLEALRLASCFSSCTAAHLWKSGISVIMSKIICCNLKMCAGTRDAELREKLVKFTVM